MERGSAGQRTSASIPAGARSVDNAHDHPPPAGFAASEPSPSPQSSPSTSRRPGPGSSRRALPRSSAPSTRSDGPGSGAVRTTAHPGGWRPRSCPACGCSFFLVCDGGAPSAVVCRGTPDGFTAWRGGERGGWGPAAWLCPPTSRRRTRERRPGSLAVSPGGRARPVTSPPKSTACTRSQRT